MICSTDVEFDIKAKEYMAYFVGSGHNPLLVQKSLADVKLLSSSDARTKMLRECSRNYIVSSSKFNPQGRNIVIAISCVNSKLKSIFINGVTVGHRRENNLKQLLTGSDPYDIKFDLTITSEIGYKRCNRSVCDSCDNFVLQQSSIVSNATDRRYLIKSNSTCDIVPLVPLSSGNQD